MRVGPPLAQDSATMRRLSEDPSQLYWEGPEGQGEVLVRTDAVAFHCFDRRMDRQIARLADRFARATPPSVELLEACLGGQKT